MMHKKKTSLQPAIETAFHSIQIVFDYYKAIKVNLHKNVNSLKFNFFSLFVFKKFGFQLISHLLLFDFNSMREYYI